MKSDLLERAEAHLASGNLDDAANIANVYAKEIEPKDPAAYSILARVSQERRRFSQAVRHASNALLLAPGDELLRDRFVGALGQLAAHNASPPLLVRGARQLLDRLEKPNPRASADAVRFAAANVDFVLPMSQPAGSELNLIELVKGLKQHTNAVLWSNIPPHPKLLELDPGIRRIMGDDFPRADTLVIGGSYTAIGDWCERVRPRRVVLHHNVPNIFHLLQWLGASTRWPAARIDILYPSRWMRDAVGVEGSFLPSPIDLQRFAVRPPIPEVNVIGRLSRDELDKHHPQDPEMYTTLIDHGHSIEILGGSKIGPFLPVNDALHVQAAHQTEPEVFLQGLDLFLYRTGTSFDASGRVVTEAMACGVPVVCHRIGGYSEIIEQGENGFLFDTTAEAIEIIRAIRHDTKLIQRLRDGGRGIVERLFAQSSQEDIAKYFVFG